MSSMSLSFNCRKLFEELIGFGEYYESQEKWFGH